MSRAITPVGIVALTLAVIAGVGWPAAQKMQRTSFEAGMSQATEAQEKERQQRNETEATLTGRVTDTDFNNVKDAVVSFRNERNQQQGEARTDSKGLYVFKLFDIDVRDGDRVSVEISKAGYQTIQERVRFHDEFHEFRTTLLKGR